MTDPALATDLPGTLSRPDGGTPARPHPRIPRHARPILAVVVLLAVVAWAILTRGFAGMWSGRADAAVAGTAISASGTIEGEEVIISAEVAGRVRELPIEEGSAVTQGAVVARLDDTLLAAQLQQARAAVEVAQASAALMRAGARPEEVDAARAARDQAAAALEGARSALANAVRLREQPQELIARIDAAIPAAAMARARLAQMEAGGREEDIAATQASLDQAGTRLAQLRAGGRSEEVAAAQAQVEIARTRRDQVEAGAREEDQRRLGAAVDAARAQVTAAQAKLTQVKGGPRHGDLAAAQAALDQAETRLSQLREGTPRAEDVAVARLAWEAAEEAYRAANTGLADARDAFGAASRQRENRPAAMAAEQAQVAYVQAQQGLHQAEANVEQRRVARDQARAQYDKALAGPTEWEVRLGVEAVAQARASVERLTEINPQDVQVAEAQVSQALAAVTQAEAQLASVQLPTAYDREAARLAVVQAEAQRDRVASASGFDVATAESAVAQAEAMLALRRRPFSEHDLAVQREAVQQAEAQLRDLRAMREQPLQANAQVDAARAQVATAESGLAAVQARLDAAMAGPTAEQTAVAEAQVRQAQAAAGVLQTQVDKMTSTAPRSGVVTKRLVRAGETVAPGTPLLTLADHATLTFTVYVSERDLGLIRAGQAVDLSVDAYPRETFRGAISSVGTRAEFTPRNVQTKPERVNLVFAVKVRVANADGRLKPGMPVDARIRLN